MKKLAILSLLVVLGGCATDRPYNEVDFAQGGPDAPLYNERTATFMTAENEYSNIDSYRPKTAAEKEQNDAMKRYYDAIKNVYINYYSLRCLTLYDFIKDRELEHVLLNDQKTGN